MQTGHNTGRRREEEREERRGEEEERERRRRLGFGGVSAPIGCVSTLVIPTKKTSDRPGLNFYPSHFLPKKYYNNILPKFTQGFNKRWSDVPNFRSKNLYFRRVFLDPSFILMTS